ncbi:manganese transport protein MntH [Citrobacter koseri]|uniref:Manganese transport protein MntH n=1 Tax=Citrobacter koseri TaxID=545 RepID=A0A2X2XQ71_CITKO|nr:manganese transport protein MntH [Citrobacter koseri]
MIIPSLPNSEAVFLAAGVLGATIMPHVIYLHSSLTQHLHDGSRQQALCRHQMGCGDSDDNCRVREPGR